MSNILLCFDDKQSDRINMIDKATEWSNLKSIPLKIVQVNAHNNSNFRDDVCQQLHDAKINEGDKLAVISGGSTNLSNSRKSESFSKGFIDVLKGLNKFLQDHSSLNLNPFVALRSNWFNINKKVTDNFRAFTRDSLGQLLESLPDVSRKAENHIEIETATREAVKKAPNEIFTMAKKGDFNPENKKAFFAFLDKAFGSPN
jgi:hypothetical protein